MIHLLQMRKDSSGRRQIQIHQFFVFFFHFKARTGTNRSIFRGKGATPGEMSKQQLGQLIRGGKLKVTKKPNRNMWTVWTFRMQAPWIAFQTEVNYSINSTHCENCWKSDVASNWRRKRIYGEHFPASTCGYY